MTSRHSILNIIKGNEVQFDVLRGSQGKKTYFSHLMLTWGVMSETDIQSEKYRFLGHYRYYLTGFIRIVNVHRYHGHLYYLPEDTDVKPKYEIENKISSIKNENFKEHLLEAAKMASKKNKMNSTSHTSSTTSLTTLNSDLSSNSDNNEDVEKINLDESKLKNLSNNTLVQSELESDQEASASTSVNTSSTTLKNATQNNDSMIKKIYLEKSKKEKEQQKQQDESSLSSAKDNKYDIYHTGLGPKPRYTSDEQVTPEMLAKKWEHVDMKFSSFSALNFPFLAHDQLFGPDTNPTDDLIDLIYTDTFWVYNLMLDDGHGTYCKGKFKDDYHIKRTKAFVLIPDGTKVGEGGEYGIGRVDKNNKKDLDHGILDLDGEVISYEPIRMEVLPKLINVYAPPNMDMDFMGKTIRNGYKWED